MCKSIVLWEPNYNVLPGTDDYFIEMNKFVRLAYIYYCSSRDYDTRTEQQIINVALLPDNIFYNNPYVLFDDAVRNWQWHFYYRVTMKMPRTLTP